ncbi:uracil permease [Kwoniella mangroviensis CBS 10435]|uniref:Uracil permease n=1 Tax=Kwoniella mangroviensis CBS 10435 TaxID=1331196 RepID=A0A1B9IPG9_9TREE|nr:uracil permease [Kwoniella mangroviensis CBS 10435]
MKIRVKEVLKKLESDHVPTLSHKELFLATTDLLPVTDEKKTWDSWTFVGFWVADCFNLNTFLIASSMITAGLNWWQPLLCVVIGYSMVGPFIVLNARPEAVWGLVFPAVCRTTFGVFGTFWPIFTRATIACVWWGSQCWLGGQCVHVLIRAIWPSFTSVKNTMPASTGTSTDYVISFIIFWLLSLPTIWVPIHKLRWYLFAKAIVGPLAGLTLLGWSVKRAGGAGPIFSQPATLKGSKLAWQMVTSIGDCFGNLVTLIVNAPDFASRAKNPSASVWSQLITMPLGFSITSFLGIVICSSSAVQWGQPIWNVIKIMEAMLDGAEPSRRAGLAFIAMGFIYVTLLKNVVGNSIAAGCDFTALFPRYLSIRRGGYIAAIVGICMAYLIMMIFNKNPWLLYKSPQTLTKFLAANGIFLACIAGPMISDYWLVRKGHVRINDLYVADKKGWYWYMAGMNWRGYLGMLCGFAINLPGFISTIHPSIKVSQGAMKLYYLLWLTGPGVSGLVYYLACLLSPPPGMSKIFEEVNESAGEPRVDQIVQTNGALMSAAATMSALSTAPEIEAGPQRSEREVRSSNDIADFAIRNTGDVIKRSVTR